MLRDEQSKEVIELCQKLVSIRSYSGEEEKVGKALKEFFEKNHYDEVKIDSYGNVIGIIKGNRPGK
jgi:putative aminopeptidase FrvX